MSERKVREKLTALVTGALFPSSSNIWRDGVAVELIMGQKLDNVLQKEGYSEMEATLDFYSTIIWFIKGENEAQQDQWLPQGLIGKVFFVGTNTGNDLANKWLKSCAAREPWRVVSEQDVALASCSERPSKQGLGAGRAAAGAVPCAAAVGLAAVAALLRGQAARCPPARVRRRQLHSRSDTAGNQKGHLCFLPLLSWKSLVFNQMMFSVESEDG